MRIVYIPERENVWEQYYGIQASQSGHGIPGFEGVAYQRGGGLGSFLVVFKRTNSSSTFKANYELTTNYLDSYS